MDGNFFYHSIYNRFSQRQPFARIRAFVNVFFKELLFNYWLDLYQISLECSLDSS